jgi:hypothetical protein
MFRVVVNPLFSRAVGCIRHQIPVSALSRSFRRIAGKRNRENEDNDEFRYRSTSLVWEYRIGRTVMAAFVKKLGLGYFSVTKVISEPDEPAITLKRKIKCLPANNLK